MASRFPIVVLVLLCSLLGSCGRSTTPVTPALDAAAFVDVTDAAGFHFTHTNGANGLKLLPETMGSGVIVFDYDGDGLQDVFLVNSRSWNDNTGASHSLYRNKGDGTFEDVSTTAGFTQVAFGMGGCAGDFDNDGYPDLFITALGGNRLYRNIGGKRFEDATESAGLKADTWPINSGPVATWAQPIEFPSSATWLDFDGDGKLDLFVCQYLQWSPVLDLKVLAQLPGGKRAYVPPTQFAGTHCQLFRNLGNGRFEDVSKSRGMVVEEPSGPTGQIVPIGKSLGVVLCDPDGDGWPDLIVANDTTRNFYFHNIPDGRGGRKYEEIGLAANVAYAGATPRGGMGIDAAYLQSNSISVLIANFSNEPNTFLTLGRNPPVQFRDLAETIGVASPSRGPMKFGAVFLDFDLDGKLDFFTANGHLEPDIALARPNQTQAERSQLFRNTGTQDQAKYSLVTAIGDLKTPLIARGCAVLDFNRDGRPDLILTSNGGRARLYRNDTGSNPNWIRLKLVGDGIRSNRDAIGARVEVTSGGYRQTFLVTSARGYLSQSELPITVGLGDRTTVESVVVTWPGKEARQSVWNNLAPGQEHRLTQ